jgi:hypothetical protein
MAAARRVSLRRWAIGRNLKSIDNVEKCDDMVRGNVSGETNQVANGKPAAGVIYFKVWTATGQSEMPHWPGMYDEISRLLYFLIAGVNEHQIDPRERLCQLVFVKQMETGPKHVQRNKDQ